MSDTERSNWKNDTTDKPEFPLEPSQTTSDEIFECLSHQYRRLVLEALRTRDVTTEEDISSRLDVPQNRVTLELRHRHLPKLRRAGYIQWSEQTGYISRGPSFPEIEQYLRVIAGNAEALPHDWP